VCVSWDTACRWCCFVTMVASGLMPGSIRRHCSTSQHTGVGRGSIEFGGGGSINDRQLLALPDGSNTEACIV
jgi:hypothetical protein